MTPRIFKNICPCSK